MALLTASCFFISLKPVLQEDLVFSVLDAAAGLVAVAVVAVAVVAAVVVVAAVAAAAETSFFCNLLLFWSPL